jgi:DNA polymerase-3 subunit delta
MPTAPISASTALALICGDDDFSVKERGAKLYAQWTAEIGGMDHEIIDAAAANSGEAIRAISRVREAINTLPFFGTGKVVWLKNCNFLGEDRTASTHAVTEALAQFAQELKDFKWGNVRLLITAGKADRRKTFYKTVDKAGAAEVHEALSVDTKDWAEQAEARVRKGFAARGRKCSEQALGEIVERVGPNARQLESEVEKLCLYAGDRPQVEIGDVEQVCIRNKNARAFAMGDALGERNVPVLLRRLDEELWEVKLDRSRSVIGLLYGIIFKVRSILLVQEMLREGWVKSSSGTHSIKSQLAAIPADRVPADTRFNPAAMNPYVVMKAIPHAQRYSRAELVEAMDLLLKCNLQLVSSSLDEALVLQQTLIKIAGGSAQGPARPGHR